MLEPNLFIDLFTPSILNVSTHNIALWEALNYCQQKNFVVAHQKLQSVVDGCKTSKFDKVIAVQLLGLLYWYLGLFDEAQEKFLSFSTNSSASINTPKLQLLYTALNSSWRNIIGQMFFGTIDIYFDNVFYFNAISQCYECCCYGRYDEALKVFDKTIGEACKDYDNYANLCFLKGYIYFKQDDYVNAKTMFAKVKKIEPNYLQIDKYLETVTNYADFYKVSNKSSDKKKKPSIGKKTDHIPQFLQAINGSRRQFFLLHRKKSIDGGNVNVKSEENCNDNTESNKNLLEDTIVSKDEVMHKKDKYCNKLNGVINTDNKNNAQKITTKHGSTTETEIDTVLQEQKKYEKEQWGKKRLRKELYEKKQQEKIEKEENRKKKKEKNKLLKMEKTKQLEEENKVKQQEIEEKKEIKEKSEQEFDRKKMKNKKNKASRKNKKNQKNAENKNKISTNVNSEKIFIIEETDEDIERIKNKTNEKINDKNDKKEAQEPQGIFQSNCNSESKKHLQESIVILCELGKIYIEQQNFPQALEMFAQAHAQNTILMDKYGIKDHFINVNMYVQETLRYFFNKYLSPTIIMSNSQLNIWHTSEFLESLKVMFNMMEMACAGKISVNIPVNMGDYAIALVETFFRYFVLWFNSNFLRGNNVKNIQNSKTNSIQYENIGTVTSQSNSESISESYIERSQLWEKKLKIVVSEHATQQQERLDKINFVTSKKISQHEKNAAFAQPWYHEIVEEIIYLALIPIPPTSQNVLGHKITVQALHSSSLCFLVMLEKVIAVHKCLQYLYGRKFSGLFMATCASFAKLTPENMRELLNYVVENGEIKNAQQILDIENTLASITMLEDRFNSLSSEIETNIKLPKSIKMLQEKYSTDFNKLKETHKELSKNNIPLSQNNKNDYEDQEGGNNVNNGQKKGNDSLTNPKNKNSLTKNVLYLTSSNINIEKKDKDISIEQPQESIKVAKVLLKKIEELYFRIESQINSGDSSQKKNITVSQRCLASHQNFALVKDFLRWYKYKIESIFDKCLSPTGSLGVEKIATKTIEQKNNENYSEQDFADLRNVFLILKKMFAYEKSWKKIEILVEQQQYQDAYDKIHKQNLLWRNTNFASWFLYEEICLKLGKYGEAQENFNMANDCATNFLLYLKECTQNHKCNKNSHLNSHLIESRIHALCMLGTRYRKKGAFSQAIRYLLEASELSTNYDNRDIKYWVLYDLKLSLCDFFKHYTLDTYIALRLDFDMENNLESNLQGNLKGDAETLEKSLKIMFNADLLSNADTASLVIDVFEKFSLYFLRLMDNDQVLKLKTKKSYEEITSLFDKWEETVVQYLIKYENIYSSLQSTTASSLVKARHNSFIKMLLYLMVNLPPFNAKTSAFCYIKTALIVHKKFFDYVVCIQNNLLTLQRSLSKAFLEKIYEELDGISKKILQILRSEIKEVRESSSFQSVFTQDKEFKKLMKELEKLEHAQTLVEVYNINVECKIAPIKDTKNIPKNQLQQAYTQANSLSSLLATLPSLKELVIIASELKKLIDNYPTASISGLTTSETTININGLHQLPPRVSFFDWRPQLQTFFFFRPSTKNTKENEKIVDDESSKKIYEPSLNT